MYTITCYQMGTRWFLDLPDFVDGDNDPDDLERVGSFCDLLELAADGTSTVVFQLDSRPFDGADVLELSGTSGGDTGAYYHLRFFKGNPVDLELWLDGPMLQNPHEPPQQMFIKKSNW